MDEIEEIIEKTDDGDNAGSAGSRLSQLEQYVPINLHLRCLEIEWIFLNAHNVYAFI